VTTNKLKLAAPDCHRFDLVTVVWSGTYTRLFLAYALPSELAPGNIPRLAARGDVRYRIFTTEEDAGAIRASRAYAALVAIGGVEVDVVTFTAPNVNKYQYVSLWHVRAANDAFERGAYAVFLCPDGAYANDSLGALAEYARQGWEAVMTLGLRTSEESATAELRRRNSGNGESLAIEPRDAVTLALRNLHQIERSLFWDAPDTSTWPAHLYFRIDRNTFIAHCWHLHPIMVKPRAIVREQIGTIDGGSYLADLLSDPSKAKILTDTDKFFFIEFTPHGRVIMPARIGPHSVKSSARWAKQNGETIFRHFFATPILVHAEQMDQGAFERVANFEKYIQAACVGPILALGRRCVGERLAAPLVAAYHWLASVFRRSRYTLGTWRRALRQGRWRGPFGKLLRRSAASAARPIASFAGFLVRAHALTRIPMLELHRQVNEAIRTSLSAEAPRVDRDIPIVQVGLEALDHGDLPLAHDALRLARTLDPTEENTFYETLVGALRSLKSDAEARARLLEPKDDRPRRVFSMVVWGDEYVDNLMRYTLRSMFAPGNLPALQDGTVLMSIVTTPSGEQRIRAAESFRTLERYSSVQFFIFPEALSESFHYSRPTFNFYRLYGALDHTSIHFARALRADIYFIVVDGLLSSNTLSSLARFMDEGYDICANASIVSNRETFLPALDTRFGSEQAINISARELANLGMDHRHDYITQRLVVADNTNFDKYPRELYFPTEDGLVVHALYQHPLVISHRAICKDVEFDYFIVDAKLMARILPVPSDFSRLKVVVDANDAYVANFAPKVRRFETTGRPLNVKDFVQVHLGSKPIHHHIWQHSQLIRCDTPLRTHLNPERVSGEFLAALVAAQRKWRR